MDDGGEAELLFVAFSCGGIMDSVVVSFFVSCVAAWAEGTWDVAALFCAGFVFSSLYVAPLFGARFVFSSLCVAPLACAEFVSIFILWCSSFLLSSDITSDTAGDSDELVAAAAEGGSSEDSGSGFIS